MPTILDPTYRAALVERLSKLTPESRPLWGSFDSRRMLCHLADQLHVALGDVAVSDVSSVLKRTVLKWIVLYLPLPMPRGKIQTVPEMLSSEPESWAEDLDTVKKLLSRLAEAKSVGPHPAFGPLSHSQWAILAAKHADHHLQQFGV